MAYAALHVHYILCNIGQLTTPLRGIEAFEEGARIRRGRFDLNHRDT